MNDRLAQIEGYWMGDAPVYMHAHPNIVRDVLALVEIAKAARVVNGDGVGEFDTRTTSALFPLRRALSVLDDREET